jgi:hypothetical protein
MPQDAIIKGFPEPLAQEDSIAMRLLAERSLGQMMQLYHAAIAAPRIAASRSWAITAPCWLQFSGLD